MDYKQGYYRVLTENNVWEIAHYSAISNLWTLKGHKIYEPLKEFIKVAEMVNPNPNNTLTDIPKSAQPSEPYGASTNIHSGHSESERNSALVDVIVAEKCITDDKGKTVRQWFETLPEPYRSNAIRNSMRIILDSIEPTISDAICCSFDWEKSIQGFDYWDFVYQKIKAGQIPANENNGLLDTENSATPYTTEKEIAISENGKIVGNAIIESVYIHNSATTETHFGQTKVVSENKPMPCKCTFDCDGELYTTLTCPIHGTAFQ
jgi:hypothetical protein